MMGLRPVRASRKPSQSSPASIIIQSSGSVSLSSTHVAPAVGSSGSVPMWLAGATYGCKGISLIMTYIKDITRVWILGLSFRMTTHGRREGSSPPSPPALASPGGSTIAEATWENARTQSCPLLLRRCTMFIYLYIYIYIYL